MNSEFQIRETNTLSNIIDDPEFYEGIPLTTDWLERAGYKNIGSGLWDNGSEYDIDFYENGSQLRLASSDDYVSFGPVFTYLHELQLLMAGLGRPITFDGK